MELFLKRTIKTGKSTIGELSIGNRFYCYTLEDTDRGLKQTDSLFSIKARKLFGVTAIPAGRYEVALTYSNRFKKYMPQLLNVPGYEGIRIHIGNRPEETEGCILVGLEKSLPDAIGKSRLAFEKLMAMLEATEKQQKVFITIS
jgi:hypothetical protein